MSDLGSDSDSDSMSRPPGYSSHLTDSSEDEKGILKIPKFFNREFCWNKGK